MSETKHTPGPWRYQAVEESGGDIIIRTYHSRRADKSGTMIADVNRVDRYQLEAPDDVEANARLLAAAPDLLDACYMGLGAFGALRAADHPWVEELAEHFRAVIRKATDARGVDPDAPTPPLPDFQALTDRELDLLARHGNRSAVVGGARRELERRRMVRGPRPVDPDAPTPPVPPRGAGK